MQEIMYSFELSPMWPNDKENLMWLRRMEVNQSITRLNGHPKGLAYRLVVGECDGTFRLVARCQCRQCANRARALRRFVNGSPMVK